MTTPVRRPLHVQVITTGGAVEWDCADVRIRLGNLTLLKPSRKHGDETVKHDAYHYALDSLISAIITSNGG